MNTVSAGYGVFSLVAPNGWGKTQLAEALAGGCAELAGGRVPDECAYWLSRARVGTLSLLRQGSDRRFSARTVLDYLTLAVMAGGARREEARQKAGRLLEDLGLSAIGEQAPWTLSGGEEQVIFLVGSLAQIEAQRAQQHVMLCDDPFMMLDELRIRRLEKVLLQQISQAAAVRFLLLMPRLLSEAIGGSWIRIAAPPPRLDWRDALERLDRVDRPIVQTVAWRGVVIKTRSARRLPIPDGCWQQDRLNLTVGPNGSGKSLFGSLLLQYSVGSARGACRNGRLDATGSFLVDNEPVRWDRLNVRLRVGIVPQHVHRIRHTLDQYLYRYGIRTDLWADSSGGESQRQQSFGAQKLLCTYRHALALYSIGCNIIVFDEPDTSLDDSAAVMVNHLVDFLRERGVLTVIITHAPELYRADAHRVSFCPS